MKPEIEAFYRQHEEPLRSCLLALREIVLRFEPRLTEEWKYSMPMFYLHKKMFCYLWWDKKTLEPYVGIVNGKLIAHPALEQGARSRMKIFRINPREDIPLQSLLEVLELARAVA